MPFINRFVRGLMALSKGLRVVFRALLVLSLGGATLGWATPPERLHYPQQTQGYGEGWNVSRDVGKLGITIPVATVKGDIPIPVVFRLNASFAQQWQMYSVLKSNIRTGIDSYVSQGGPVDSPILGTLHFGMILPATGWSSGDVANPSPGQYANYWVMEDGTEYTGGDFTASVALSPSLFSSFGLTVPAAAYHVDSTGTVAFFPTTSAGLGSWASKVAALTSSNDFKLTYGVPTGYQVVMDRDKARIFAFDPFVNVWVPILWVDRFGHWVSFQWGHSATTPSGFYWVETLRVLNQRGKGFQVQSTTATTQTVQPLLRVDFINIQAPTLQVTGYSGTAPNEPASMGGTASKVSANNGGAIQLRPTEVQIGNPADIPAPSWMSVGLPQPIQADTEAWPSNRVWTFGYDSQNAELIRMSNPFGVTTTFTWGTNNLYSLSWLAPDVYRSVISAVSTDSRTGITLTKNFTWSLPSTSSGTWKTSLTQAYSGGSVLPGATSPNTTTYTFAPPTDPNYNNAVITNISVSNNSKILSNTAFTMPTANTMMGIDKTLSIGVAPSQGDTIGGTQVLVMGSATTYPSGDTPNKSITSILDPLTGHPKQIVNTSTNFQDVTNYTYDSHPELLDPDRLIQTDYQRTSGGVTTKAPSKVMTYNASTFLPTSSYIFDPASNAEIGQNFTSYDSGGHLTGVSNFASGSIFSTSAGIAHRSWAIDLASGLPTSLSVSYSDPRVGLTDNYSESHPLSSYDTADRLESFTDGLGVTTNTAYDALGRVVRIRKGGQAEIDISYPNEWTTTSVQNGRTTTTILDGFGHVMTRIRGADGVTESYSIDANDQVVQTILTSPTGNTRITSKDFDAQGRISKLTPPVGPSISYVYSVASSGAYAGDQVITQTYSGQAFTTSQTLDQWGQPLASVGPKGTVKTGTYDAMGHPNIIAVTPAGGAPQVRTFSYNGLGFLTSKNEP